MRSVEMEFQHFGKREQKRTQGGNKHQSLYVVVTTVDAHLFASKKT